MPVAITKTLIWFLTGALATDMKEENLINYHMYQILHQKTFKELIMWLLQR